MLEMFLKICDTEAFYCRSAARMGSREIRRVLAYLATAFVASSSEHTRTHTTCRRTHDQQLKGPDTMC